MGWIVMLTAIARFNRKVAIKVLSLGLSRSPPLPCPESISRILVFGMPSIGNTLLSVPMFVALRNRFPNAAIAMGYRERRAGGTILRSLGLVDRVFHFDADKPFLSLTGNLRAMGFRPDIVVRPFFCVDGFIPALLLTRARWRVGHVASDGWSGGHDNLLNVPVWMTPGQHESERYLALTRAIGCNPPTSRPHFPVGADDRLRVVAWLESHDVSPDDPILSIHPGSSPGQTWKRWPMEKWSRLIEFMVQCGFRVIILGDSTERGLIDTRQFAAGRVLCAAGIFNLDETAALLNRSRLLVCNDSGLGHLAHYLGCKVVILFGPTDAVRTGPVDGKTVVSRGLPCQPCYGLAGDAAVMACGHHACLRDLDFETVIDQVFTHLKDAATSPAPP